MKDNFSYYLFFFGIFFSTICYSQKLPTEEEIQGIISQCSAGRIQEVRGDLETVFSVWKGIAKLKGEAKSEDLGAIIREIKNEDKKVEVYKIYISCIKETLPQFLKQ